MRKSTGVSAHTRARTHTRARAHTHTHTCAESANSHSHGVKDAAGMHLRVRPAGGDGCCECDENFARPRSDAHAGSKKAVKMEAMRGAGASLRARGREGAHVSAGARMRMTI